MKRITYLALIAFVFSGIRIQGQTNTTVNPKQIFGFIENKGQVHDQHYRLNSDVKFLFPTGKGLNVQLRSNGFSYDFYRLTLTEKNAEATILGKKQVTIPKHRLDLQRIDIDFVNSNQQALIEVANALPNYLQFKNHGAVQQYEKITYKNIYPLIDAVFYADSKTQKVKYDFVVHPGGDYRQIKLQFKGYKNGELVDDQLQLSHSLGTLNEIIPDSWMEESGEKVNMNFTNPEVKQGQMMIGFTAENPMNLTQTLVIDPEPLIVWGTYLGDSLVTIGTGVTTDKNGFIYTCGVTQSIHSLATTGAYQSQINDSLSDAYLMKFNQYGQCLWATYFGGNNIDIGMDVVADTMGHVYLYGTTFSDSNIVVEDSLQDTLNLTAIIQDSLSGASDAFLVKFKRNGDFIWSTYYGGAGDETGTKLTLDFKGNVYLTGTTGNSSAELGTTGVYQEQNNGGKDAFVTKIDTAGVVVWSSYFGGESDEEATGISFGDTNIFICGYTNSMDSIATDSTHQDSLSGMIDGYISKFDPATGQRVWATYFGGSQNDFLNSIKAYNNVIYFVGTTLSDDGVCSDSLQFQTVRNGVEDAFIGRIASDSGTVIWSTYYGGALADFGIELDIEMDKQVFLIGTTVSDSAISSPDVQQVQIGGGKDVFLTKFTESGFRQWGTYYGGPMDDEAYSVDVFGNTSIYITGTTQSDTAIVGSQYFLPHQDSLMGISDGFLVKLIQNTSTLPGGFGGGSYVDNTLYVCEGDTAYISLMGAEIGIDAVWAWYKDSCGGGASSLGFGDTLIFFPTTNFVLYVRAESVTNSTDCISVNVVVAPKPIAVITSAHHFCSDDEYVFSSNAGTGETTLWSGPHSFASSQLNPSLSVTDSTFNGTYELKLTNQYGCSDTATIDMVMFDSPIVNTLISLSTCFQGNDATIMFEATGSGPFSYHLNGLSSTDSIIGNLTAGNYLYDVVDVFGCYTGDSLFIGEPDKIIISATLSSDTCKLNSGTSLVFVDSAYTNYSVQWLPAGIYGDSAVHLPQGNQTAFVSLPNGCSDSITVTIPVQYSVVVNASPDSVAIFPGESVQLLSTCSLPDSTLSILWTPSDGLVCDSCGNTFATPLDSSGYVVTYTHTSGCFSSDTVKIFLKKPCGEIFIPTAFSPNDDGLNDKFCVLGGCITAINVIVFNQWGEVLFTTNNIETCWDGKYQGKLVQNDSYVYHIDVTTSNGENISQNGSVEVNH